MSLVVDAGVTQLVARLGVGRDAAIRASALAAELGISERQVGALAAAAIDEGWLIGSVCTADRPGYFLIRDEEDLRIGTEHSRARAVAILVRIRKLRALARDRFGEEAARLFDVEGFTR